MRSGFARSQDPARGGDEAAPEGAAPAAAAEIKVQIEELRRGELNAPLRITGTLKSDETLVLSTRSTGLVKQVLVREGERIRKGQLLVVLEDTDILAMRDRARASLRVAEAKLAQARTGKGMKDTASRSELRRAEQSLQASRLRLSQSKSLSGIMDSETENRVSSARASVQAARERLKSLVDGSRRQEKLAAEAAVARARVQVERQKSALERREQLLRDGAIAREAVDNARRDHEAALADLDAARQQASLVNEGPRAEEIRVAEEAVRQQEAALKDAEANRARRQVSREEIETAQTQVQQAEAMVETAQAAIAQESVNTEEIRSTAAAVEQARADLRYQDEMLRQTRVFSPVNGIVSKRNIHVGESVVQMRNELMQIVSLDTLYVEASAPESALASVAPGMPADIYLDVMQGRKISGAVQRVIPVAEGQSRSVRVRLTLGSTGSTLPVVGGFARAIIHARSASASLSAPRTAIVTDEGQPAVFLLENGKVSRRPVRIGDAGGVGDRVPILEGVREGDRIILNHVESLTDGQAVQAE